MIYFGDCIEGLQMFAQLGLRAQTCVTSPPYFALRDYGIDGQLGMEQTPDEYVASMVSVFRCVRDVLTDDGTLWLNLGDTMNNRRKIRGSSHQPSLNGFAEPSWAELTKQGRTRLSINNGDLKEKDTMGVPWALAFALRADGWYLRQEIIWHKTFGKPEPSSDRFPNRHEQIFLLSKSKKYKFDKEALPEFARTSVWSIPPTGCKGHGAAFAERVAEPCILAGSVRGDVVLDPFMGSGTTAVVAKRHRRQYLGCEIDQSHETLQTARLSKEIA